METLTDSSLYDIFPDILTPKKWNDLIIQGSGIQTLGSGVSPIATAFQSANFKPGVSGWQLDSNGHLEANSATIIGSASVGSLDIPDTVTANSFHVSSTGDTWWGATTLGSATAKVLATGVATFSNVSITGGSISGTPISSIPNTTGTDISLLEKTHNLTFSVTDADTVAWSSGTITMSNGRTFTISAGNTGNMVALTYIYLDPAVSSTVLQTTTTYSTATGNNKALIGTAQNNTVTASFIPYGAGQILVDGANIGALSIVAGNIAASTITASKMSVSQLSAITADLGAITAGTIVLPSGGYIRSGQTAYNTGTGFYLGNDLGTPKFSIGDPTGRYLTWNGSTLTINGYNQTNIGSFGGDGSSGALSITSGTTTINLGGASVVILNYTTISITGTGKLAFSNPASTGTVVIIKSQGNITLTSSAAPMIDCSALGAAAGTGGASTSTSTGNLGTDGTEIVDNYDGVQHKGKAGTTAPTAVTGSSPAVGSISTAGGALSSWFNLFLSTSTTYLYRKYILVEPGSGGAGGSSGAANHLAGGGPDTGGAGGAGGRGGGALVIECAGAWNFTTANGISVAGANGTAGSAGTASGNTSMGSGGGGGGGGAGGMCLVLYNTLTANSGTINVSGGNGGNGGNGATGTYTGTSGNAGSGGGGAGAGGVFAGGIGGVGLDDGGVSGTNGTAGSGTNGGTGGTGGSGSSTSGQVDAAGGGGGGGGGMGSQVVSQNKYFA